MSLNKNLILKLEEITSLAAIEAFKFVGKLDKINADKAAVDVMRKNLNNLDINGKVVIGEGELDEAPMLFIGENLGTKNGIELDIAVDPVEGTNFVANNLPGALSVLAVAEKGNLFNAPETYMDKIAFGKDVPSEAIDLDFPLRKNIINLSDVKNKKVPDLTVCILNRPRHKKIINELKKMGVKLKLIKDGDVSGALLVTDSKYNVDLFLGIGGGPEGVLAAAALDAYGCKFQGRFLFNENKLIERAKKMGIVDLNKKYELFDIIKGDSIFCASGITDGDLVKGVQYNEGIYKTETLVTHKESAINIVNREVANT